MKTLLKLNFGALILLASLFSISASAATSAIEKNSTTTPIKKVVVTGNTKVIIIQNDRDMVKMDELDMDKVSVKQIGHTLTISSNEIIPITVMVYVRDIYRINASDRASVSTSGKFTVKNLQVILTDRATGRIKAYTESLYTAITHHAKLKLLGTSTNHDFKMAGLAQMNTDKFTALKSENITSPEEVTASLQKKQIAIIKL